MHKHIQNSYDLTDAFLAHSTVCDYNFLRSFPRLGTKAFDLLDDIHPLHNLAEHHMLPVQPLSLGSAEEELGPIGVGASISHGQNTRSGVLQLEILVLKLGAIDRLATRAISSSEVTSLAHEVGNHPVERRSLESEPLLAGTQCTKVFRSLRNHVFSQLHYNIAQRSSVSSYGEEYANWHDGETWSTRKGRELLQNGRMR